MKSQITNHKSQTNSKFEIRNSKHVFWSFEFRSLDIVWNLVLGAWNFRSRNSANGFGLVEIVVAIGIISVSLFALMQTEIVAIKLLRGEKENLEAMLLAEESLEAVRSLRDESWASNIAGVSDNTSYYPIVENGKWKLSAGTSSAINGKYQRSILFQPVVRNASDQIASSGTADPNTKKIIATVAWGNKNTKILTAYITNFLTSITPATETKSFFFENGVTDGNLSNFPSNNSGDGDPTQSFTTSTATTTMTRADLYIKKVGTNLSDLTLEVRISSTGQILGTSTILTGSAISTSTLSWVSFRFPDFITLAPNTNYTLRLRSAPSSTDAGSGSTGPIHWGYQQTASSPYAGGNARRYVGRLSNPNDSGQLLDQYDFSFRIFTLQ